MIKKKEIEEQQQEQDKQIPHELYLSSQFDHENYKELEEKEKIEDVSKFKQIILYIFQFLYYYICFFGYILIFLPFIGLAAIIIHSCFRPKIDQVLVGFWMIISCSSISYALITYFFFPIQNDSIRYLFQDGIFFTASTFLVFTFLRTIIDEVQFSFQAILKSLFEQHERIMCTVFQTFLGDYDGRAYFLDYNDDQQQEYAIKYKCEKDHPVISKYFSWFTVTGDPSRLDCKVNDLIRKFNLYMDPNLKNFLILVGIIIIKLGFVFIYIYIHSIQLGTSDIIDMTFIIFVYFYITWSLNRLLGNNDLIRKQKQLQLLNELIQFSDVTPSNYQNKIDVTCPISLESWDNIRKFILKYKQDFLGDLELSYLCLIFYYMFIILVIMSYYFELYWIISENSFLLSPIIVIMSTFNFVFLSVFLLFRFYQGTKYGEIFGDLEQSVHSLLDVFQDLDTMYSKFFIEQQKEKRKEIRFSLYGLFIKRIKLLSKYHIQEKVIYQDRLYGEEEKNVFRRKIIKNIIKSLQKVKLSIQADSKQYSYKFLNIIELNFNDFLFTLAFGLITTLPTIVPKFISFYKK